MTGIAPRTTLIDLEYLDQPGHIATCVLETADGLALVDPGPSPTTGRLREGLRSLGATLQDVRILLLTHIHLDHAGSAGVLTRELPRLSIYVHERGAPHLADPTKLLRSATMIYGDQMEQLWGEVAPVPHAAIRPLAGGERLHLGGREIAVAYTPGHAWHHVSYLDGDTGFAFTGDVVGEQPPGSTVSLPVTPPPDIDVELMVRSGQTILEWRPTRLFVTHFGLVEQPAEFVREHEERLLDWSERVRASLARPGSDEERAAEFADEAYRELVDEQPESARSYPLKDTLAGNWVGLARYWRKKQETQD
jgi:glyoxylase-like metal-dependent hydrolase (beta-lactamase superfamily II)